MRECKYYEVTVEKLLRLVHSYTDPIRICVVMGDAWLTCDEAKHMRSFELTHCLNRRDEAEEARLLKYYKDVPVWNLTVWVDGMHCDPKGRAMYMGIEAKCHYKDVREGYLAEKADRRREQQREYRRRRKERKGADDE